MIAYLCESKILRVKSDEQPGGLLIDYLFQVGNELVDAASTKKVVPLRHEAPKYVRHFSWISCFRVGAMASHDNRDQQITWTQVKPAGARLSDGAVHSHVRCM
jgi:hypothetical protein